MEWFDKLARDPKLRFAALTLLCLAAYFSVIVAPQTVNPDAYLILPAYDRMGSLSGYIEFLSHLKTTDFQPVRDLSLYLDWFLWKEFKFNTFIFHNVILWIVSCFYIFKLISLLFPKLSQRANLLIVLGYSVYPLFAGIICWGIARKHILAFLFTILATYHLLVWLRDKKKRNVFFMILFYFLGVFSQPIGILWPFWAIVYVYVFHKESLVQFMKAAAPLLLIFILGFTINYIYYKESPLFTSIFTSKTSEVFLLFPKLQALGHYFHQLLLPYNQTFAYGFNLSKVIAGWSLVLILTAAYFFMGFPRKTYAVWALFGLLPLGIILNTPRLLFDPYLLLPSLSMLVIIAQLIELNNIKWIRYISIPLFLFWTLFSHYDSLNWTDHLKFGDRNFTKEPSCITASRLIRAYYELRKPAPQSAKEYLINNQCGYETSFQKLEWYVLYSQTAYFENKDLEQKISILKELGHDFFYPNLILAAVLIEEQKINEAITAIERALDLAGRITMDTAADPIIPLTVLPFCELHQHSRCLQLIEQIVYKRQTPYF